MSCQIIRHRLTGHWAGVSAARRRRAQDRSCRARAGAHVRAQRCCCRWRRCRSPLLTRRQSLAFLSSRLSPGLTRNSHPASQLRPHNDNKQAAAASDVAKRAGAAAAAALLALSPLAPAALANEFDVLGEPTPTNYFFDDAGVLSKSTRSQLNKKLSLLEVRVACGARRAQLFVLFRGRGVAGRRPLFRLSLHLRRGDQRNKPTQQTNTPTNQHTNKPTNQHTNTPTNQHTINLKHRQNINITVKHQPPHRHKQTQTGYRVEVVTVRKLEFETDAYAFADKALDNWYPGAAADKKGVVLMVTASKEGAVTGGKAFLEVRRWAAARGGDGRGAAACCAVDCAACAALCKGSGQRQRRRRQERWWCVHCSSPILRNIIMTTIHHPPPSTHNLTRPSATSSSTRSRRTTSRSLPKRRSSTRRSRRRSTASRRSCRATRCRVRERERAAWETERGAWERERERERERAFQGERLEGELK